MVDDNLSVGVFAKINCCFVQNHYISTKHQTFWEPSVDGKDQETRLACQDDYR
jgi:hypothetical protein